MSEFRAALTLTMCSVIGGAAFLLFDTGAAPRAVQALALVGCTAIGVVAGLVLVGIAGVSRVGRRHWTPSNEVAHDASGVALLFVHSRCVHHIEDVRCRVRTPTGITYTARRPVGPYTKSGGTMSATYPSDFPGAQLNRRLV